MGTPLSAVFMQKILQPGLCRAQDYLRRIGNQQDQAFALMLA
jgi:hypothetical protein